METNQHPAQEYPAQPIAEPAQELSAQPIPEPALSPGPAAPSRQPALSPESAAPTEPLYDPAEAAQIVNVLTDACFDPEYILLFGKLAGGTPHSDAVAYDLLVVVRQPPAYNWIEAKRILRYKVPTRHRKITYINLYILPLSYVESNRTPFLYFAHAEGELLYCRERYRFRRPKHPIDFAQAYADARFHFETFHALGDELLERSQSALVETRNPRLAAQFMAQAAVYFYHTLYYVFHGQEFDLHDPVVMHERMRTLSTHLMLVFDDNHIEGVFTLPCLKRFLLKTPYSPDFDKTTDELRIHLERVDRMGRIVEKECEMRMELYKELSEEQ